MRLTAIEAVRYGALEGECLSGLSEGLTVVLGPNESGKSTMTALTRHVLYGYPDGRSKERRLRAARGLPCRAAVVRGCDRGVGDRAARRQEPRRRLRRRSPRRRAARASRRTRQRRERAVVPGGLRVRSRRARTDRARRQRRDRVAALRSGLRARGEPDGRAQAARERAPASCTRRAASKPAVNAFAAQMRDLKLEIAALESQAAEYADEQARLARTRRADRAAAQPARRTRRSAPRAGAGCRAAWSGVRGARRSSRSQVRDADAAISGAESALAMVDVDERVLAAAPELSAVLEDLSGFRQRLEAMAAAETTAAETERRAKARLAARGRAGQRREPYCGRRMARPSRRSAREGRGRRRCCSAR